MILYKKNLSCACVLSVLVSTVCVIAFALPVVSLNFFCYKLLSLYKIPLNFGGIFLFMDYGWG